MEVKELRKSVLHYIDNADSRLLKMMKALAETYHEETDHESSDRISIEQYNKEIDASLAQIEKGKTYTHEEMGARIKQWAKQ